MRAHNKTDAPNPAIAPRFQVDRQWREDISIKLGRLWFLVCEAPVLVLMVFVSIFGNRAVYAYSQSLGVVYIASLVLLLLTSLGIVLFGRQTRWVGVVGLATAVLAVFAGPPALAE